MMMVPDVDPNIHGRPKLQVGAESVKARVSMVDHPGSRSTVRTGPGARRVTAAISSLAWMTLSGFEERDNTT
jgi:hypothetical protein